MDDIDILKQALSNRRKALADRMGETDTNDILKKDGLAPEVLDEQEDSPTMLENNESEDDKVREIHDELESYEDEGMQAQETATDEMKEDELIKSILGEDLGERDGGSPNSLFAKAKAHMIEKLKSKGKA